MNRFVIFITLFFFLGPAMAADRYVKIISPDGSSMIDPDIPVTVSGTGKGLFEGNVVIRFETAEGKLLIQQPTTMHANDIAAAGEWQKSISLPAPVPGSVRLVAFSPSPKDGEAAITSNPVMLVTGNAASPSLAGVRWQLSEYLDVSGKPQAVNADTVINAQFTDGRITGSAGCNNYSAGYEISDSKISIGPAMATRKYCAEPEGVMALEQAFLQALAAASHYQLAAERLELHDSKGFMLVRFVNPGALQ
jgi:heat shock protein HslJ